MAQRLKDDESLPLDGAAAVAALPRLRRLLEPLSDVVDLDDLARTLPGTSGDLAAAAIDTWDDGDGAVNFVQALLMESVLARQRSPVVIDDDVNVLQADVAQVTVRHGALTVRGSLRLHAPLIVLGDLTVDGKVADFVDWSRLAVTGNLRCRTMRTMSPVWVGGRVETEAVCFTSDGKLWTGRGLDAVVVISTQDTRGVIGGEVHAAHHVRAEDWRAGGAACLARLQQILVPEAFARADRTTGFFVADDLLDLVEAGTPYLLAAPTS